MTLHTEGPAATEVHETASTPADVHAALHQIQKIADSAAERLNVLAENVTLQAREQMERGARVASEHPLALFGTAFAVGVALGLLLPRE